MFYKSMKHSKSVEVKKKNKKQTHNFPHKPLNGD